MAEKFNNPNYNSLRSSNPVVANALERNSNVYKNFSIGDKVKVADSDFRYGGEEGEIVGKDGYKWKVRLLGRSDKPIVELQPNQVTRNASALKILYTGKAHQLAERIIGQDMSKPFNASKRWVFNPVGPLKWKFNQAGSILVAKPCLIKVAGDKRYGWKTYRLKEDGTLKEIDIEWFTTPEEAQRKWDMLK